MATRLGIGIAWAVLGAISSFSAAAQPDNAPDEARRRADELLVQVDRVTQRLKSASRSSEAGPLAEEAARLRGWLAGPFQPSPSTTPELHAVAVQSGGAFPPGHVAEEETSAEGYAEVRVSGVGRPVVLVLSSQRGIHWRIVVDEKVRIFAVLLTGAASEVSGLPEGALVLDTGLDEEGRYWTTTFTHRDTGEEFERFEARLHDLTGLAVQSMTGAARYDGRPLIVGPQNAAWRAQIVARAARRLRDRALAVEREPLAADLAKLRFLAAYHRQTSGSYYSSGVSVSVGEFTIKGPILSTLRYRSSSFRQFVREADQNREYALDSGLMSGVPGEPLTGVKRDPRFPDSGRLAALAIDSRRRRLIAPAWGPESALFAYDITQSKWSILADPGNPLLAIAYAPDLDVMFAITAAPRDWSGNDGRLPGPVHRNILKLSADGKVLARIEPSQPLEAGPTDAGAVQLLYIDGKLILLGRPRPGAAGHFINSIQILDPATGRVLYAGELRPQTDDGVDAKVPAPVNDYYRDRGRLARWIREMAATEKAIANLRRAGRADQAEKIERALVDLRRELATTESGPPSDEPELYLVGSSGSTVLELTDTSRPIVLAIRGESPRIVRLSVLEDVRLLRVFSDRNVLDVPPGVPVARWPRSGEQGIKELTRYTDTTRVSGGRRVTLGPESGDWRLDRALRKLARLNLEYQSPPPPPDRAVLEAVRFRATYRFTALGDSQGVATASAEFTARGPVNQTLRWHPPALREIWMADRSGERFAKSHEGLLHWDSALEKMTPIAPAAPSFDWQRGWAAAFDTRRERLLLTSEGSGGHVYAYDIGNRLWQVVRSPGVEAIAMCYVAGDDSLYVLRKRDRSETYDRIVKYTAHGVRLGEFRIRANPQWNSATPRLELGDGVQIADAGDFLALVTAGRVNTGTRGAGSGRVILPMLYLVERDTGDIVYSGGLREHARVEALSQREIASAYEELLEGTEAQAEPHIWKLASGGERTVAFLADQLGKSKDFDREKVRGLIVQLDDEKFAVREKAQRELAKFGPEIERLLTKAAETSSAEVRARVRRLVEPFHRDPPRDPETLRQYRGLDVLDRIATPAALDLLRRLAEGDAYPQVARRAKQVLESLAEDEARIEAPPSSSR